MKNILNLIKINFISLFKNMFGLYKKKTTAGFVITAVLLIFVMYIGFGSTINSFAMILKEIDAMEYIFFFGAVFSFAFVLFFITYEAQSYFFKTKDFELLSSLPIKNSHIVISKYISVLLSAYLYSSFIMIPTIVIYFLYVPFNVGLLFLFLLGFLFFPLVPTALGTILGLIISLITCKLKFSSIISLILFVLIFVLYFIMYYYINGFVTSLVQNGENLMNSLQYYLPSIVWFFTGFIKMNFLHIILNIVLSILTSYLIILLLSIFYKKINFNLMKSLTPIVKKAICYNKKHLITSLLKIEGKRFVSYTMYVMNSCFSVLFLILLPFFLKFAVFSGESTKEIVSLLLPLLPLIIICINSLFAGMCNTTSSSISIEGQQIALLKSMPISPFKIYFSKIFFNVIIIIPFIFISSILNLILFFESFNFYTAIMLFIVPSLALISLSVFGLLLNLLFPKFNFENINQVVKQSICVFIVVLLAMILGTLPLIISFYITSLNVNLFITIYSLIYLALLIISIVLIKVKGEKLYLKLQV